MLRFATLALILSAAAPAVAQAPPRPADVVSWRVDAEGAARGGEALVVFRASVAPGWKMYALDSAVGFPLAVNLDALPAGLTAAAATQSDPHRGLDPAFGEEASTFVGTAVVTQAIQVGRSAARGQKVVSGRVRYAVCNAEICLPPASAAFRVGLPVR